MITVTLQAADTLRLVFAYDASVVAALKRVDGARWQPTERCWTLPLRQFDALAQALGDRLSVEYDVLVAWQEQYDRRIETFVRNTLAAGISLDVVDGRIVASGGVYVPDPWSKEIAKREADILRLGLVPAHPPAPPAPAAPPTRPADDSQLTAFDKLAANNWRRWQENEEIERQRRRRKQFVRLR